MSSPQLSTASMRGVFLISCSLTSVLELKKELHQTERGTRSAGKKEWGPSVIPAILDVDRLSSFKQKSSFPSWQATCNAVMPAASNASNSETLFILKSLRMYFGLPRLTATWKGKSFGFFLRFDLGDSRSKPYHESNITGQ
jgi:hypothetical protein